MGHGSGWSVAPDQTNYGGALEIDELSDAFEQAGVKGNQWVLTERVDPVEILAFDAGLMGTIENVYQFKDLARQVIVSQTLVPAEG